MRRQEELKDRIRMAVVENLTAFPSVLTEPENVFPAFIERVVEQIYEITQDEISWGKRR